jgi:uncharacterized lipoprotein YbaY
MRDPKVRTGWLIGLAVLLVTASCHRDDRQAPAPGAIGPHEVEPAATAEGPTETAPTAGVSSEPRRPLPVVRGDLFLSEHISLPAGARVRVRVIRLGASDEVVATLELAAPRRMPIPFELVCDPATIDESAAYGVEAEVVRAGAVVFATPGPVPVLAGGAPTLGIKLLLRRMS